MVLYLSKRLFWWASFFIFFFQLFIFIGGKALLSKGVLRFKLGWVLHLNFFFFGGGGGWDYFFNLNFFLGGGVALTVQCSSKGLTFYNSIHCKHQ